MSRQQFQVHGRVKCIKIAIKIQCLQIHDTPAAFIALMDAGTKEFVPTFLSRGRQEAAARWEEHVFRAQRVDIV